MSVNLKIQKVWGFFIAVLFLALPASSDIQTTCNLEAYGSSNHFSEQVEISQQDEWSQFMGIGARLSFVPSMAYTDYFQCDSKATLFVFKSFQGGDIGLNIQNLYMDFLFVDAISIKLGYFPIDFGYDNSYFHPLQITEFNSKINQLYNKIKYNDVEMGTLGVPALQFSYFFPQFLDDLFITISQSMIFLDLELYELYEQYFTTNLNVKWGNLDVSAVAGYSINETPAAGGFLSYLLPFELMFYSECVWKKSSFKPVITDVNAFINGLQTLPAGVSPRELLNTTRESEYGYLNICFGLSSVFNRIFTNDALTAMLEYFYYGEGWDTSLIEKARIGIHEVNTQLSGNYAINRAFIDCLAPADRTFMHAITLFLNYALADLKLSFSYNFNWILMQNIFMHTLVLNQQIENATFILGCTLQHSNAADTIFYTAGNWGINLQINIRL